MIESTDNPATDLSDFDKDRRNFCISCAKYSLGIAVATSFPLKLLAETTSPFAPYKYTPLKSSFENDYRNKWSWDDVTLGTHNLNCWFQQNCLFYVYKKDGKITREEQVGNYPQTNEKVPDFNPRGCQKGCSYSDFMYSEARITHPLKRSGERGEGKWEKISWDEALTGIADKMIKAIDENGTKSVVVDPGGNIVNYLSFYSLFRFFDFLDSTILDINCELGDDQQGAAVTYGEISNDRSGDDYFYSDLIFIWGGNPAYTQIPNFHFLTEARYNGTKIVAISPDLNASAIKADYYIPVKPGTDSALANSMAHLIISEKLYNEHLLKEQTDLTFLVRTDNNKLLKQSDVRKDGSELVLYRWDKKEKKLEIPSQSSLKLDTDPALEGEFNIKTYQGIVTVKPVFEFLKEQLKEFTPEKASKICGVAPDTIRKLTTMLVSSKAATNTCTSNFSKFYHGDIIMRSQILAFILAGHLGKKGDGFVTCSFLVADGGNKILNEFELTKDLRYKYLFKYGTPFWLNFFERKDWNQATYKYVLDTFVDSRFMANSTLFWNLHGGISDISERTNEWDPHLKRDIKEYINEMKAKEWQVIDPPLNTDPKVYFSWAGNALRRVRGSQKLLTTLWPKFDLVVALEMRMSSTATHADYILPVSGAYEKTTVMAANTNTLSPFFHTTQKAVENIGESKDEWEIACLLAKKIKERAKHLKIVNFKTARNNTRKFTEMYNKLTSSAGEKESELISKKMTEDSSNLGGISWDKLKEKGYTRFTELGKNPASFGNACDIKKGETISPHTWHTEKKEVWTTLTGRIQFYIDHDWYLELNEQLPIHKNPPTAGGDYPFTLTGGHARWSIHSIMRTDPGLLRLQRGEPFVLISVKDAEKHLLNDDDEIKIFNDVDYFFSRVKISATVQPGQLIMYHGWESYQFKGGKSARNVMASPLNPIEMVGDYPYLKPVMAVRQPGQSDRDTRVEIEKV
ncbi:MAG: hypothetical protein CO118_07195 [Flavobacteriales bacterium CG_4_9_14_3_um_filter_32_8]|nr:MAG: hypothetical protein CO118_07195 [Flavobacteriales bacterium CG_4_9_14_3_um_filter_32_8]